MQFHYLTLSVAFIGVMSSIAFGQPIKPVANDGPVSFFKDIRPILQQNCQGCHQPAKTQGGYVMTEYASILKPGETGKPTIVPGNPDASYLVQEIRVRKDGSHVMPKGRDALPTIQIQLVERWVKEGAKDDTPASAKAVLVDTEHPPVYLALPVVTSLAFSPDGQYLAATGYHEVIIHKADGSGVISRLVGESERVQSLAFSPDGKRLAVAGGSPGRFGEIQIWDVAKQKLQVSSPLTFDTLFGVSWSPDGKIVAFGCADNTVRAIDSLTGKQVLQMGTHSDWVLGTAFSQDGLHLASIGRDMTMKLTDVPTQRFVDNITSITPGALKGGLMAIDRRPMPVKTMQKIPADTPGAKPNAYDELLVAGSDGITRLYKMHREVKREIGDDSNKVKQFEAMPGRISTAKFNADGKRFAAASSLDGKGEIRIFDTDTGKKIVLENATTPAYTVAWKADGKVLASAGFDGKIWLHDTVTGKLLKEFAVTKIDEKKAAK